MRRPEMETSTKEERLSYIRERFRCISDCDMCGICAMFQGKDPELVFQEYIDGHTDFTEIMKRYR
jgi:hypothetical protein